MTFLSRNRIFVRSSILRDFRYSDFSLGGPNTKYTSFANSVVAAARLVLHTSASSVLVAGRRARLVFVLISGARRNTALRAGRGVREIVPGWF